MGFMIVNPVCYQTNLTKKKTLIIPKFVGNITVEAYSREKEILLCRCYEIPMIRVICATKHDVTLLNLREKTSNGDL